MRFALLTIGTLGDVVPFVAIGRELRQRGHEVVLATHTDFEDLSRANGLEFVEVGGSFQALMNSPEGRDWLESAGNPIRYRSAARRILGPRVEKWIADVEAAMDGVDAAAVLCAAWAGLNAAEARGLPLVMVSPYPWVPSRHRSPMFLPRPKPLPFAPLNAWLSWRLFSFVTAPFKQQLAVQREAGGLGRVRGGTLARHVTERGVPDLHMYSAALVERPPDWGEHVKQLGFAFLDGAITEPPPAELEDFIAAGPPPVYIGFGSMTGRDPAELTEIVTQASKLTERRFVVGTGWGGVQPGTHDNLFVVRAVSHDWLFPRCAAAVHHGGAGTTAAALRADLPAVIVPFFGDQPVWAAASAATGVAVHVDKKRLTPRVLAEAIERVTTDEAMRERARVVGAQLRSENGASAAAEALIEMCAEGGAARRIAQG